MANNSLYFNSLRDVSGVLAVSNNELYRLGFRTTGTVSDGTAFTVEMVFQYMENTDLFNFRDSNGTPDYNRYMTLLHIGQDTNSPGYQVCLKKNNSNGLQLGIRYKTNGSWTDTSFSTIVDDTTSNPKHATYMMAQFTARAGNTGTLNKFKLYSVNLNNGTNSAVAPTNIIDLSNNNLSIATGPRIGIGSPLESIIGGNSYNESTTGYITTNGYNSYIAQNIQIKYCRVWQKLIPVTSSSSGEFAMFNTNSSYSLYSLINNNTYVSNAADLKFELNIPDNSTNLADLYNNINGGVTYVTPLSAITSNNLIGILPAFIINNLSSNSLEFNQVAASTVACIAKGSKVKTPNGEILIENLNIGDVILTHDNRPTKIVNIMAYNNIITKEYIPLLIKKGTHGAYEDLYLSKTHCLLIDDLFVYGCNVVNDRSEIHGVSSVITYYLIRTEQYFKDTLVVNGVTVETWGGFNPTTSTYDDKEIFEKLSKIEFDHELYGRVRRLEI